MVDEQNVCPACARGNAVSARMCSSCGIRMIDGGLELDPLLREMWLAHARNQRAIRASVNVLVWAVIIFALLTLIGGYAWYTAVENGTVGGFS